MLHWKLGTRFKGDDFISSQSDRENMAEESRKAEINQV